jgi:uncharacterized membrane protein
MEAFSDGVIQTGIYWVNHHYLVDDLEHVAYGILWSNLAMLFALSLIPTRWALAAYRLFPSPSTASPVLCRGFPG